MIDIGGARQPYHIIKHSMTDVPRGKPFNSMGVQYIPGYLPPDVANRIIDDRSIIGRVTAAISGPLGRLRGGAIVRDPSRIHAAVPDTGYYVIVGLRGRTVYVVDAETPSQITITVT